MSTIQLEGLNKRQRALADVMWSMDSREQVESFIRALHPKDRREAQSICELMILAFIDEIDTVEDETKILIDNCR